jgi:hypothetical protein
LFAIAVAPLFTAPHPRGSLPLLLLAGPCLISAWRRSTIPLYTVTDDELLIGGGWRGYKRIPWHDIKHVQQDAYGVRLIGRQWFGGTPLSLTGLPRAERDEFMRLVGAKVDAANAV